MQGKTGDQIAVFEQFDHFPELKNASYSFNFSHTWTTKLGILAKTVPTTLTALPKSSGYGVRINN